MLILKVRDPVGELQDTSQFKWGLDINCALPFFLPAFLFAAAIFFCIVFSS